jgi:hypothetical protein
MTDAQLKALRTLAIANQLKHYAVHMYFTCEFTCGSLAGMTHDDQIGFCNRADADEWVAAVNRANAKGKVDYRVINWTFAAPAGSHHV